MAEQGLSAENRALVDRFYKDGSSETISALGTAPFNRLNALLNAARSPVDEGVREKVAAIMRSLTHQARSWGLDSAPAISARQRAADDILALIASSPSVGADLERLHQGLRERGCRLPSADPVTDALAALDEWMAIARAHSGWRPIEEARKDGSVIWAVFHPDVYPRLKPGRPDLARWNGMQVPLRHQGLADDGFDLGWTIAAPVGSGGFPDEWIAGFIDLPPPPVSGRA